MISFFHICNDKLAIVWLLSYANYKQQNQSKQKAS